MSAFTGDTLPTLPFKNQDMPDRPNDIFPSTLAFKQALDSTPVALQGVHNSLIANLQDAGVSTGASLFLGAAPVAGVSGATIYDQIVDLRALIQSLIGGVIPPSSITTAMIQDGAVTPIKLNGNSAYWYGLTTNVGNAYSASIVPAPTSYYAGLVARVKVNANSSGAVTLNINGLGAVAVLAVDGSAVDDLVLNSVYTVVHNGTAFILQGRGGVTVTYTNYQQTLDVVTQIDPLPAQLPVARFNAVGVSVGNFALIGGGGTGAVSAVVDAYDRALARTTPTALSVARQNLAATNVGNFALFGGGTTGTIQSVVDAYDTALTRTTPTALSTARQFLAATTVGNFALFGGGDTSGGTTPSAVVDAYDTALTRTTPTALSQARLELAAATVGNFALFAGGWNGTTPFGTVDAYDTALTRTTPAASSFVRYRLAATRTTNFALFAGGIGNATTYQTIVEAYDTTLVRTTPTALTTARASLGAASLGTHAIFAGGRDSGAVYNLTEVYDSSLVRSTLTGLTVARQQIAAARVGNYAIFAGGSLTTATQQSAVEAYSIINPNSFIPVTAGSKYNFGGGEVTAPSSMTLKITAPATGYVKYKTGVIT